MSKKQAVMSHDPLAQLADSDGVERALDAVAADAPQGYDGATAQAGGDGVLSLPASLTIGEIGDLHARMVEVLSTAQTLTLDGSEVDMVDGAGLQLLAALGKAAGQRNLPLSWSGVSDSLRAGAAQLGITGPLGLDGGAGGRGA